MTYLRHLTSTMLFAIFSPLYLLYILVLFLISPFGLIMSKLFKKDTARKLSTADYVEPDVDYSLNELFTTTGVRHVAATIFFALLSPLYMVYIVGLVLFAPIGLMLSRATKHEQQDDSYSRKINDGHVATHSFRV